MRCGCGSKREQKVIVVVVAVVEVVEEVVKEIDVRKDSVVGGKGQKLDKVLFGFLLCGLVF